MEDPDTGELVNNSICTDYYLNEDESVAGTHTHAVFSDTSQQENEWLNGTNNKIYSFDGVGWIKLGYESKQFTVTRVAEPPQSLQMKILIGAV